MPPDAATASPQARTCASESSVSRVRSMRQSGSLSHSRRCWNERASVFRQAFRTEGAVPA